LGIPLRILIVEDSEDDTDLLLLELARSGYEPQYERVETRTGMQEALERQPWDIILSDYSLPQFSGRAALEVYKLKEMDIPFIVVSGAIGETTAVEMMKAGVHDYLIKGNLARLGPAIERELRDSEVRRERKRAELALLESENRYRSLIETMQDGVSLINTKGMILYANRRKAEMLGYDDSKDLIGSNLQDFIFLEDLEPLSVKYEQLRALGSLSNIEYSIKRHDGDIFPAEFSASIILGEEQEPLMIMAVMRDITERKQAEVQIRQANQDLSDAYDATLEGWSHALELREQETAGHSQRAVAWTLRLAEALGITQEGLVHIRRGALLHDIGKMGIPDSILLKPGPLTEDEWVVMRQHPVYAYHLLKNIPHLKPALVIPYCHHEKWDGSGYPQGLIGEEIPFPARIFSVVDVWDALTSARPYRPAWPEEEVRSHIAKESGKSFDPRIVSMFLEILL
jgi:PAS domain S-box-containing protein